MDRRTLPELPNPRHERFALLISLGQTNKKAYLDISPSAAKPHEGGRRYNCIPEIRARIMELKGLGKIDPDDSVSIRACIAEIHDRAMSKTKVYDKHGKHIGVWKSELAIALAAAKSLAARTGALDPMSIDAMTEDMTNEQGMALVRDLAERYGQLVIDKPTIEAVPETGT